MKSILAVVVFLSHSPVWAGSVRLTEIAEGWSFVKLFRSARAKVGLAKICVEIELKCKVFTKKLVEKGHPQYKSDGRPVFTDDQPIFTQIITLNERQQRQKSTFVHDGRNIEVEGTFFPYQYLPKNDCSWTDDKGFFHIGLNEEEKTRRTHSHSEYNLSMSVKGYKEMDKLAGSGLRCVKNCYDEDQVAVWRVNHDLNMAIVCTSPSFFGPLEDVFKEINEDRGGGL